MICIELLFTVGLLRQLDRWKFLTKVKEACGFMKKMKGVLMVANNLFCFVSELKKFIRKYVD